MADLSRRRFITVTALGVAAGAAAASGLGAAAAVPQLLASASRATAEAPDLTPLGTDVIAHLRDASTGEVSLMVGNREVVYRDTQLVARMLKGARRAAQEG